MDRDRWKRWAPYLSWPCPTCQSGNLKFVRDTLHEMPSRNERLSRDDPSSNPDESLLRFTALLKCDLNPCGEVATVAGDHYTHWLPDGSDDGFNDEGFEVFSIIPSPLPFKITSKVPWPVERAVREAATLFWVDHRAAANRAREAIEAILTDLGIPTVGSKGRPLRLHDRIEDLRAFDGGKWIEQSDMIEAAKWIGNEGTHASVDREAVLDAFEMLETVIDDIYVHSRHAVLAKARSTNIEHRKTKKK